MSVNGTQRQPQHNVVAVKHFEAWYIAYLLLGVVQLGLAPILLPLSARHGIGGGLIYGAFSLTGLAAPLLGAWSDRRQRHRSLLIGGLLLTAIGIILFSLVTGLAARVLLAAIAGLGVIAPSTVGTMFIVETAPKAEWDERISSLQGWTSAGQIGGLLLAGGLAREPRLAFLLGAAGLVLAALISWRYAPAPGPAVPRSAVARRPAVGGEAGAVHHQFHHVNISALRLLLRMPSGPLAQFFGVWLLSLTATSAVSIMLPVAMTHEYGTTALLPAAMYAAGIAFGLPLYPLTGRWEARTSAYHVMLAGFAGRIVLLAGLAVFGFIHTAFAVWPILIGFALTQVIWPWLSVSSNTLAVTLDPVHRGEGVGLLNAGTSAAATIGGVLGGVIVQEAGYATLCALACIAVALAWIAVAHAQRKPRVHSNPEGKSHDAQA